MFLGKELDCVYSADDKGWPILAIIDPVTHGYSKTFWYFPYQTGWMVVMDICFAHNENMESIPSC